MKEVKITVKKTARYFQEGEFTDAVRSVWILCHGYGQLAEYFLNKCILLKNPTNVIIAPEGLHRYYLDGNYGRVGASWMTREDRESDIIDYVEYIDQIIEIVKTNTSKSIDINVLGFSQGCATVSRWKAMSKYSCKHLVLYAGVFPPDTDWRLQTQQLQSTKLILACGDEDEFINQQQLQLHLQDLDERGISYQLIAFKGKHQIYDSVLKELIRETK